MVVAVAVVALGVGVRVIRLASAAGGETADDFFDLSCKGHGEWAEPGWSRVGVAAER